MPTVVGVVVNMSSSSVDEITEQTKVKYIDDNVRALFSLLIKHI